MRKLACGMVAHVDAGKTTLSEALLYRAGAIRTVGRVDHGDAFLDTDAIERERGITIFSKLAVLDLGDLEITLVDTPGHVDFSAETERAMPVMDCAILVISGTDGVQGHTRTLWNLLGRYGVPVFIFVNKMDLAGADRARVMADLRFLTNGAAFDLGTDFREDAAAEDETAMEEYLATGDLSDATLRRLIAARRFFPVLFGSALKLTGIDEVLNALNRLGPDPVRGEGFGAKVYKIGRDNQGTRLTWLKMTGGTLRVKDTLPNGEKADQLRLYSGEKFRLLEEAEAGTVCAVTGPRATFSGQVLGEGEEKTPALEPVLSYRAILPEGTDLHAALRRFRTLEEEDPMLHVVWSERLRELSVQLMGEVQLEVVQRVMRERFQLPVTFGAGGIVYRETIANTVEGVGHFEPLKHYAEVHLILSPLERGAGLELDTQLSEDALDRNWQRLILAHLAEKTHLGVLTGSPITDMRITLAAGRSSVKHTEGGDFREATYRAVRQGLMQAESILLEPWYDFTLEVPSAQVGRAMTDLTRMAARIGDPETAGENTILTGSVPVSETRGYAAVLASYTRGLGRIGFTLRGYEPCHNAQEVIAAAGYEPEHDLENTPDSVFCAHGAGYTVKWYDVFSKMHLESALTAPKNAPEMPENAPPGAANNYQKRNNIPIEAADKELRAIFERTYGEVKRRDFVPKEERRKYEPRRNLPEGKREIKTRFTGPEYLLVDGYNVIFAWEELKKAAEESIDAARQRLMDILANFRGVKKSEVILVFDAYKVKGGVEKIERYHGISVVYTKEAETADTYIERTAHTLSRDHRVYVATSDGPEQMIILGSGALRLTAQELHAEVAFAEAQIRETLRRTQMEARTRPVEEAFRRAEGRPEKQIKDTD